MIKRAIAEETDHEKFTNRDLNERRAYEHLSAKYSHLDSSFDEYNPIMGQTMNNQFEKESIHSHQAKFSSSVGFRDMQPQFRNKSKDRVAKNLRSPSSQLDPGETRQGYGKIIKSLYTNFHKLTRRASEKLNIIEDSIFQNEEHLVDLVENTERFLKDIQESGLQQSGFEERPELAHSQRNETNKYI